MQHTVPIYLCNIKMSIVNTRNKKSVPITSKDLNRCIVKGFTPNDMLKRYSIRSYFKKIEKQFKLAANEEFRVDEIELLMQLGCGIND